MGASINTNKIDNMVSEVQTYKYLVSKLTETVNRIVEDDFQKKCQIYLSNYRKMDSDVIKKAKIFYILNSEHIKYYGIDDYDMNLMGFSVNTDNVFRERFVIPIIDHNNMVIGMTGYDYESNIKYLFAKTTFFDKRNSLYNKQNIAQCYSEGTAIMVEGLFDSLRLNQIGLANNLSIMGSMLFPYQKVIVNRIPNKILIPDNDEPGREALKYWTSLNGKIAIIKLPDNIKDVDDFVKGKVKEAKRKKTGSVKDEVSTEGETTESFVEEDTVKYEEYFFPDEEQLERAKLVNALYKKIAEDMKSPFYKNKREYFLNPN